MTRTVAAMAWLVWLSGCATATERSQDTKIDALERRVTSLERRLGVPEQGANDKRRGKAKASQESPKGAKAAADGPGADGPKVAVQVDGEAQVHLMRQRRKYAVPGSVPLGVYSVMAQFDGQARASKVGMLKAEDGQPAVVSCDAAAKTCEVH